MKLSVITPIHNETECIPLFLDKIKPVLDDLKGIEGWQLFFVNDGSTDNSLDLLKHAHLKDNRINVISLSRNFGYQAALLAGLQTADSDVYAIIDVDCEDPPELLKVFLQKINEGNHLAYGIRSQRPEPKYIVWCRKIFYKLNMLIADSNVYMWMAEYSMFTRHLRNAILKPQTTFPFLRTEMAYAGYKSEGIQYQRQKRIAGKSHYKFYQMARFAIAGILAGTTFPLRFILSLSVAIFLVFSVLLFSIHDLSLLTFLTIDLGLFYLLITIPLISIYLARTYKNVVNRPGFFIDPQDTYI
ncbi:glycosyltransferase [Candidatus Scalindua japonica]|uniref:Glycosyltransferase n=1 Tax=Candidatus Scalindua japonica TaxID=1284222 RepID=A0A286U4F7_9BACT|nr:glycosyltransferase family 2 protein [Candidatus Scalindua japonica]GAX63005.1 glycosyltransferase [Candidatus Scalindua japonica]